MMRYEWLPSPVGIDAPRWVTRVGCRTVLAVVHTMVSCHRLLDVVDYVESGKEVQNAFASYDSCRESLKTLLRGVVAR